jgi:uncharacterized membrane protein
MDDDHDVQIERPEGQAAEDAEEDRTRFLAFSDGVFAFAATLLAVSLGAPMLQPGHLSELPSRILALWPEALAYAISFLVVVSYWGAHRQLFKRIARLDGTLTALNTVLLLLIAGLPFPSAVLGLYVSSPDAVALYAATLTAIGILMLSIRVYSASRDLLRRRPDPLDERMETLRGLAYPVIFAASILVAYAVGPRRAMYFWLLLLPMNLVLNRLQDARRRQRRPTPSR